MQTTIKSGTAYCKIMFCIMALIISFQGHSQQSSYAVSDPYKNVDPDYSLYFAKGNQAMAVKIRNNDIIIQKFDTEKPMVVSQKEYKNLFTGNAMYEGVTEMNGKYYILCSSWNGDEKKEQLLSKEINFEKGEILEPVNQSQRVFTVDGKVDGDLTAQAKYGVTIFNTTDKFSIFHTPDKKNILIQFIRKPESMSDLKNVTTVGFAFGSDLTKLKVKEIKMPYVERRMRVMDYHCDNKGNAYVLIRVFEDDQTNDNKSHLELLSLGPDTEVAISKLETDKAINSAWLADTGKGFTWGGGYYHENKNSRNSVDGVVTFKIENGKISESKFNEIPLEVINSYQSEKTAKKNIEKRAAGKTINLTDLGLRDIQVLNDGSLILVGEQSNTSSKTSYTRDPGYINAVGSTAVKYFYGDIIAAKIAPNGSASWIKKIPKDQTGESRGGMSYKYVNANGAHYFVFLDSKKNAALAQNQEPEQYSDSGYGILTAMKLTDSDGSAERISIFDAEDLKGSKMKSFSVSKIISTGSDSFMFESKKKDDNIMVKVTLK